MRDVGFAAVFSVLFFALSSGCKDDQAIPPENTLNQPDIFVSDTVFVGSFYVRWSGSIGATSYELQESNNPGFSNPTQVYSGSDTMVQVTGKPLGIVVYYRVRALNQQSASKWSAIASIALVQATLETPNFFVPDTSFTNDFYIRWSRSTGATSYELQESDNPGFTNHSQVYLGPDTTMHVSGRSFGSVLYYRVHAMNQYTVSEWSTPRSVTLVSPPWLAHTGWTSQGLNAVKCLDQKTAIVVGGGGTVLRTANEGQTWTAIPVSTTNDLNSVGFLGSNLGFLVGNGGIVLKTTDSGNTWAPPTSGPLSGDLYSVEVITQNRICIAAKGIQDSIFSWVTIDGGTSWSRHGITISLAWVYGLAFDDSGNGVCVGGGHPYLGAGLVFRTTSGGTSWTQIGSGAIGILKSVDFMTSTECVAVGFSYPGHYIPVILRSVDNGQSWAQVALTESVGFLGVSFPSSTVGFAVGTGGSIFQTLDAGSSWYRQQSGTTETLAAVDFYDSLHGMAVGVGGIILTTSTGGN